MMCDLIADFVIADWRLRIADLCANDLIADWRLRIADLFANDSDINCIEAE